MLVKPYSSFRGNIISALVKGPSPHNQPNSLTTQRFRSPEALLQRLAPLASELGVDVPSVVELLSSQPAVWAINTPALVKDRWADGILAGRKGLGRIW